MLYTDGCIFVLRMAAESVKQGEHSVIILVIGHSFMIVQELIDFAEDI